MKALKYLVAASLTVGLLGSAFAADPAVKKASSGICHDSSSPNFGQIKDFQPYKTLDACVKSGGTLPAVKPSAAAPATPAGQVKKSSSGICHEPGSEYYDRTKDFEPFKTMADCVKSGGRAPK